MDALKEKEITDQPITDNSDGAGDDSPDGQTGGQNRLSTKQIKQAHDKIHTVKGNQGRNAVQQGGNQAVKNTGHFAKKGVEKGVEEGVQHGLQSGAKFAAEKGASAAVAGGETAANASGVGVAATAALETGKLGAKIGIKSLKSAWNPANAKKEFIDKPLESGKKWGRRALTLALLIFFFIVLFVFFTGTAAWTAKNEAERRAALTGENPLTFTKTCPNVANPPATVTCTLTATYTGKAADIVMNDLIPQEANFVSSPNKYQIVKVGTKITRVIWYARANGVATGTSPSTFTVTITLRPLVPNIKLINRGNASVVGAVTDGNTTVGSTAYLTSTTDNCGGKYASIMARNYLFHANYGDPLCNFTKDKLAALIKEKDPKYVYEWYSIIVKYESGYNPNAIALPNPGSSQASIDNCGAWGLYQMGSSYKIVGGKKTCAPGLPPPSPGLNGIYDRGDVNWAVQTTNAISDNRTRLHCSFRYYSTACNPGYTRTECFWNKYSC